MHAWHGKMLVVDLSTRRVTTGDIPADTLGTWLGGRGLGVHLMKGFATLDPFDEQMPLFFAVGPLCGTAAPLSSRMTLVSRSPLTGTIFDSSVGGTFPLKLKQAGFDAVMITGKAADPVSLEITEGRAALKEASWLWGKGCIEVNRLLEDSGEVASIGPAGERLVRMANIMVGGAGSLGRGGMGALMGAKNLKAIIIRGSRRPAVADQKLFKKACEDVVRLLRASPVVMGEQGLAEYGTSALVDVLNRLRMTPTKNFRQTWYSQAHLYSGPSLKKAFGFKKDACADCPIECRKLTNCGKPIPGYDTLSHFGALNENPDAESLIRANILCNNMGLDTLSTAATIAAYGEARGEFLIADDILDMVRKIAYREGAGDKLAEGSKRYCGSIGRPELSMSVKGLEMPAYDPRGSCGMALAYGTSSRGACHLRAYPVGQEVLGTPAAADRFSFDGKARLVKIAEDTNAAVDSLSVCKFTLLGASIEDCARMLAGATGLPYTGQQLMRTGAEIIGLERAYNEQNGFGEQDDLLPERFFAEAGTSGEGIDIPPIDKGRFREELERYYQLRKQ